MNPDILDRLLVDRALGQLSADAEALLDEYLTANPAAASEAEDLRDVVALAGQALLSRATSHALPPLIEPSFPHPLNRLLALAASFIVGGIAALTAVHFIPANSHDTATKPSIAKAESISRPSSEVVRATRTLPFWSNERALLLAADAQSKPDVHPR